MFFYEKKENDDELMFFFIRPYLVVAIIAYMILGAIPRYFICYWWTLYLSTPGAVVFLWFMIETVLALRFIGMYGKQHASFSGRFFSKYNPLTLTIKKN